MKNNSIQQTGVITKAAKMQKLTVPRLSDEAFYLLALGYQLKKLLGPASVQHFLATGESELFAKKIS